MLGAQARAAELQAAKSAAMRQKAHLEAEDRSMPPEFTPVSLTDFTRNPLITRNKGPKAFRPLVDSDLEISDAQTEASGPGEETVSVDYARTGLTESAPVAPRAMLHQHDWTASRLTPFSAQATTFNSRFQNPSTLVNSYDGYKGRPSTPPCSSSMSTAGGYVFGPDDLSPIKQEQKFVEMRQQFGRLQNVQEPYRLFPKSFMPGASTCSPQQPEQHQTLIRYPEMLVNWPTGSYIHDHPAVQRHQLDSGTSATVYRRNYNHAERMRSFTNDVVDHQQQTFSQTQSSETFDVSPPALSDDQPYDRDSKMQSFVAAQQAMAKRGKTVLHNPDLHRSPRGLKQFSPNLDMAVQATTNIGQKQFSTHSMGKDKQFETSGTDLAENLVQKQTILHPNLMCDTYHGKLAINSPASKVKSFGVPVISKQGKHVTVSDLPLSDDWYMLRPITASEKEKMILIRRKITNEASPQLGVYSGTASSLIIGAKARKWLQASCISKSDRQYAAEKIIDEHKKHHGKNFTYGIIGKPVSSDNLTWSNRVASNAVAEIMATLSEHTEERRKDSDTYTPIPAYSISATTAASSSNNSLFDDLSFCVRQSNKNVPVRQWWE